MYLPVRNHVIEYRATNTDLAAQQQMYNKYAIPKGKLTVGYITTFKYIQDIYNSYAFLFFLFIFFFFEKNN